MGTGTHMTKQPRNTTIRDKHRKQIAKTHPDCHICGQPIDYTLPHLDPGEYVVDHLIPLAAGGTDTINNKAAAHRSCNRAKSDTNTTTLRSYSTTRQW